MKPRLGSRSLERRGFRFMLTFKKIFGKYSGRHRMKPLWATLGLALLIGSGAQAGTLPAAVDGAALANPPAGDWLSYGRSYDESRFSPLDQINADSVKSLGLSWYLDTGSNRGVESTPLYADGVLYATLPWSDVIAVDA